MGGGASIPDHAEPRLKVVFDNIDTDADGTIVMAEFKAFLAGDDIKAKMVHAQAKQWMKSFDEDGDAKVSYEEFKEFFSSQIESYGVEGSAELLGWFEEVSQLLPGAKPPPAYKEAAAPAEAETAPAAAEPAAEAAPTAAEPAAAAVVAEPSETQVALNGVVASLGTAKFDLGDCTVSVAAVLAAPDAYVLMDTRSLEEMGVSMIKGAITRATFDAAPEAYAGREVVAYCTVGYLSGACVRELRNQGHSNVKNLGDGALLGYTLAKTAAGDATPLVNADGTPTNEVHTFMPDLAPLAGEGMVSHTFADPGAVLEAANASIKEKLGL